MSKLTIGVMSGVVLAAAVAVPALASAGSSSSRTAQQATVTSAPAAARVTAAAVTTKASTTTKKVTLAPVVLPVPAPTKVTPSPDPASTACRTNPTANFCGVKSVRYIVKGTTLAAHDKWLPVLTKWGVTGVTDTCTTPVAKAQGTDLCVVRANHGTTSVTVLFKTVFDAKYSPAAVQAQSDAIHAKAMVDVSKATTAAAQAKILDAANKKIAALEAAADKYNAAHPNASVNVVVAP
jgi:hypothetical protein